MNQSKLVEILSRTIKDGRVISLIHKYLKAGVLVKHQFEETEIGVPQGRRSAERTLTNILPFVEKKLFLKVNREKTVVDEARKVKFLVFSFYSSKGETKIRIHPKSVAKMRSKTKELTSRSNGE